MPLRETDRTDEMEITIAAIHCEVSESTKDYLREKISKLDKYFNRARTTDVKIHAETGDYQIELNCFASDGHQFSVQVRSENSINEAIDLAHDKMAKQLRRYKDKLKSHKGRNREKLVRDIKRVTQRLEQIADGDAEVDLEEEINRALRENDEFN